MKIRLALGEQSQRNPDSFGILSLGRKPLTYARLLSHCDRVIADLNRAGISRGDRVAVVLPNGPEMAVCFLAVAMGASCAPLNPDYREGEFEFYLSDLAPRALIVEEGTDSPAIAVAASLGIRVIRLKAATDDAAGIFTLDLPHSDTSPAPSYGEEGDEALVLHTSGTTARPKMVSLTQANLTASARSIGASLGLDASDRCLNVMPLFHIHGLVGALLTTMVTGGSIVCTPGFQAPRFLDWCDEFAPTWYTAVPTMHQAVLSRATENLARVANSRLRFIRSCSAPLPPKLMAEMEQTFRVPVLEAYGMTEASHQIATNPPPPAARKPGSVGLASGTEVAVMDGNGNLLAPEEIGEIVLRGPGVTAGYANNPDANRTSFINGWFRTGDNGRVDREGYLFITGRLKEIINRGGQKISPREIDEVLGTHPAVANAVAFAIPDNRLGEDVAAAVVLRPGYAATEIEIRNHAADRIAQYKVPRHIVFLDELPKGPTGKLQRIGLAAQLGLDKETSSGSAKGPNAYAAPHTSTERTLADIWEQLLGIERIGVNDDFLALGGDSMLAALIIARIRDTTGAPISILAFFEHPTIAGLAGLIDRGGEEGLHTHDPIVVGSMSGDLPLSSAQRRMWFLAQLEENSPAYNRSNLYRIRGALDPRALERALSRIVERHAVLRTVFQSRDGDPVQIVTAPAPIEIANLDLSQAPEPSRIDKAVAAAVEASNRPFDLARDPMLRPLLIELGENDHLLLLTMHHIASDGWSAGVLMRELSLLYASQGTDDGAAASAEVLKPLAVQYIDFARWQSQAARGPAMQESLAWWHDRLEGAPPLLALPTDRPRPPRPTFSAGGETFIIPEELVDRLKGIARGERATMFMTLLAGFQTMLHRYTGSDDIVVGAFIAGRTRAETEGLIGLFSNTLAMRGDLTRDPTFRQLLRKTRDFAFEAYGRQDVPFDVLVESIRPERNLSYQPIVQVTFQVRNFPLEDTQLAGLAVEEVDFDPGVAPYDLSFEVTEKAGGLFCKLIYNRDLFDRETITRMAGHFETLLDGIAADPDRPISRLPMLTAAERHQLLVEWNDTRRDYPHECVHRLFEKQVERTPDALAISFEGEQLTYRQLNERANMVAHRLITTGVQPGATIGICVERSVAMMAGLLGILKAGAAYLPLDPNFPRERLDYMLLDSGAPVLITTTNLAQEFAASGVRLICVDALDVGDANNPEVKVTPDDLAYVIYTSGSTGKPKGVAIVHGAVSNLLHAMRSEIGFSADDVLVAVTTLSFDIAGLELFLPLISGARVIVTSREVVRSVPALTELISSSGATVMQATPATWAMMIESGWSGEQRLRAISGGEALTRSLAEKLLDRTAGLWNVYGPTETTIWSTIHRVEHGSGQVSIGRPLANTQIRILDSHGQLVPVGVAGELYIGGDGVAQGYVNRPELTSQRFVADPFDTSAGGRLYRTGDLARCRPDGLVEYLGRTDDQLKIRGFRVEPGEVEAALINYPEIQEAAVVARDDAGGSKSLVAYLKTRNGRPSVAAIRSYLQESLPEYMIPSRFAFIADLPLTPNGKINRANLPSLDTTGVADHLEFVAPRDELERRLQTIWEEVLDIRPIGVRHEFFALGGHSLNAARVLFRIKREFSSDIPLAAMFQAPTIEGLAAKIRGDRSDEALFETVPIQPHGSRAPLFVVGGFRAFRQLPKHLGEDQPIIGLTVPDELKMRLPYNLAEFAAHQVNSILKVQKDGPYFVAGFSAEGTLAYEVAQQLKAAGREVGLLVIVDTSCPAQPLQPLVVRMAHNARVHLREARSGGLEHARATLFGIFRRAALRFRFFQWRLRSKVGVIPKPTAPTRPEDFLTSMSFASRRYAPRPYDGPVLLFRRTGDLTGRYRLKDYGWSKVVRSGLEIFDIPGDHLTLLDEPGVGALAKKLAAAMREMSKNVAVVEPSKRGYPGLALALPQIEARLTNHSGVGQAAVTVSRNASGGEKLVAYVVPDEDYLHSALLAEEDEHIEEWRTVFNFFQEDEGSSSAGFDIRIWKSSYTARPIPADEMQEWVDSTVEEILSLHPAEILEIGCGTGLLLLRIAPTSKRYIGMDFSASSLKSLGKQMEALDGKRSAVTLLERPADDFKDLDNNSFDTVIINSVVQYFPSLEYLTKVLDGAIKATKPGGAIFVGDVRSLPLLETWSASVELFHAPSTLRLSELREEIQRRVNQERELLISPAFFLALRRRYPQISRVEIRPKWGKADNEMNSYRYNVTLFVDSHEPKYLEPRWLDWNSDGLTLGALRDLLQSGSETLAIKGVVNARIEKDVEALARLTNSDDSATAGALRESLSNTAKRGLSPDQLLSLANEFDYRVEISWAACKADGSFDVFFRRRAADQGIASTLVAWPQPDTVAEDLTLHVHDPSLFARRQMLIQQVRDYARATLPESMVPAEFILVNGLPLASNGTTDGTASPPPNLEVETKSAAAR